MVKRSVFVLGACPCERLATGARGDGPADPGAPALPLIFAESIADMPEPDAPVAPTTGPTTFPCASCDEAFGGGALCSPDGRDGCICELMVCSRIALTDCSWASASCISFWSMSSMASPRRRSSRVLSAPRARSPSFQ